MNRDGSRYGREDPEPMVAVDLERPSVARAYDWYLGGSTNTAVDREFAERIAAIVPARTMAIDNRMFLRRCVTHLLEERGITQFIDLGSGIPTVGNVHEVVQDINPAAAVVYIDNDPIAVEHSRYLLGDHPNVLVAEADLRDVAAVITEARAMIDFAQPVAILMIAVLHFIGENDNPADLVHRYTALLPENSALAVTHLSDEFATPELRHQIREAVIAYQACASPLLSRTTSDLTTWLSHLCLVPPGVVPLHHWHPDTPPPDGPEHRLMIGALGTLTSPTRNAENTERPRSA